MADDPCLRTGLNIWDGNITHPAVAEALGQSYTPRGSSTHGHAKRHPDLTTFLSIIQARSRRRAI